MAQPITKTILKKEVQSTQAKLTPTVTNKQFININGSNLIFESNKNGILNYKLPNPIKLEVGDKVTLYQAFVNESGLNQDTLTLSTDIYEELNFLYYVPSQNFQGAGLDSYPLSKKASVGPATIDGLDLLEGRLINSQYQEGAAHPSLFTASQDTTYCNFDDDDYKVTTNNASVFNNFPIWNWELNTDTGGLNKQILDFNSLAGSTNVISGDNGCINYLFENYYGTTDANFAERAIPSGTHTYVKPALGTANVFIKAGNYDLDALGRIITEQISGAKTTNQNQNYLTNRLYDPFSKNYCGSRTQNIFGDPKGQLIKKIYKNQSPENIGIAEAHKRRESQNSNYHLIGMASKEEYNAATMHLGDFCVSPDLLSMWERNMGNSVGWTSNGQTGNNQAGPIYTPINAAQMLKCMIPVISDEVVDRRSIEDKNEIWQTGNAYKRPADGQPVTEYMQVVGPCHQTLWFPISNLEITKLGGTTAVAAATTFLQEGFGVLQDTYVGAQSFSVDYGNNRATRFSINNLHEPHKIPSVTNTGKVSDFAGQQATKFNLIDGEIPMPRYPIEASSGVLVNNFCAATVKETEIYKNAKQELNDLLLAPNVSIHTREYIFKEYNLHKKKFHEFYQTEQDARNAFKTTLWARLGFKYEQLGNINSQLDYYTTLNHNPPVVDGYQSMLNTGKIGLHQSRGVTTHNAFDFSDIQACANMGSIPITEDTSTSATLEATPAATPAVQTIINMYSGKTHAKMGNIVTKIWDTFSSNGNKSNGDHQANRELRLFHEYAIKNEFEVLCDSQSFDADDLPDLNSGKSYYLIHSNIIKPNGLDSNGESMNLLGVMSKQNSSNDTIYSVDGVENTNTEEKVLTQIEMVIKNSDGTIVPDSVIGKNSGFIIMIEKNISPETDITMASV